MRLRFSLFTKILLWFFLNLVALAGVLFLLITLQFRIPPNIPLPWAPPNRFELVARQIIDEMRHSPEEDRDSILKRFSEIYQLEFLIYSNSGEQLAGKATGLPREVLERVQEPIFFAGGPPIEGRRPIRRPPFFTMKTSNPTRYWAGVRMPYFIQSRSEPIRATLLAQSDSMTGNGLFFDPKPWILAVAAILVLSVILWFPFVRSITSVLRQMTIATERIAEERFDMRVNEDRSDEIGRLGKAINHMAGRLSVFINGQKRFLGDVSHELNSPLARMQFALGILEDRVDPANRRYVKDVQEDVELMSKMIAELLTYSKAGVKSAEIRLEPVRIRPIAEYVVEREVKDDADVRIDIDGELTAMADGEMLSRALANVIRNAVRYAGSAGEILISGRKEEDKVVVVISDNGPGAPEHAVSRLFDPFYRVEPDRARATGGAGLGLAIVKSCVEACGGTVTAGNRTPSGLEIIITLRSGDQSGEEPA